MSKKILFCTSVFREDVNSAGRHMIDLVKEFDRRGLRCEVVTNVGGEMSDLPNTEIRSLGLGLRGTANSLRLLYEIYTPIALYIKYLASHRSKYAAAVTFSPSIFWFVYLKLMGPRVQGKKILILRDLFPLWLVDVGILRPKSLAYRTLDYFCRKQLQSYDVILVQDEGDARILRRNYEISCEIDVLVNWYSPSPRLTVADDIIGFCGNEGFTLAVVGNFGPAQDLENSCELLNTLMIEYPDLRILFIGQSDKARSYFSKRLMSSAGRVRFEEKMSHDEVINALAYVDAGFFSLDKKNQQGHFPGKVLAYLMAGRPVFGSTGVDAPIAMMLEREGAGIVTYSKDPGKILKDFAAFRSRNWPHDEIKANAHNLYSSGHAFDKIMEHIKNEQPRIKALGR